MSASLLVTRLLCLCTLLCGLWFSAAAYARIDAWLLTQRVSGDLQSLRNLGQDTPLASVISTQAAAERAVSLNNRDADIRMNAGLISFYRGHLAEDRRQRVAAFKNAIAHYEAAVDLRPAWPHHYRHLHDLYYLTLRPQEPQSQMLRNVAKYGKWSNRLKFYLLERTLARPRSLPDDLRQIETELLDFLLQNENKANTKKLAGLRERFPASIDAALLRISQRDDT